MKKKSALLVSISMVLVAVLALTTASFAWFTASMNPTLDGFDVQVTTSNALLVGVRKADTKTAANVQDINNIEFKTTLSLADLHLGYVAADTAGTTTANSLLNEFLQGTKTVNEPTELGMTSGSATQEYKYALGDVTPTSITGAGSNGDIKTKKIELATDNKIAYKRLLKYDQTPDFTWVTNAYKTEPYEDATNAKVYKTNENKPTKDIDTTNKTIRTDYINFDIYFKANFSTLTNIEVKLDLTSKAADNTTYAGSDFYALNKAGTGRATIADEKDQYWLPTAMRTAFVITNVQDATGAPVTTDTAKLKVMELDDREPASIVNKVVDPRKEYNIDHKRAMNKAITDSTSADFGKPTDTTDFSLFTMDNNTVYKMRVYMWIEGNDAQCISNISAGKFKSIFKFVGTAPVVPVP